MFIQRTIQKDVENSLFKGKIIRIYGLRRSGKTTLSKAILEKYGNLSGYFNCEIIRHKSMFESLDVDKIKNYFGEHKLVVLDEAQNVSQIGKMLKLMIDTYPDIQILATGSSSFDIANQTGEPLVGRAYTYTLFPLSLTELKNTYSPAELFNLQHDLLRFGSMPSVLNITESEKVNFLDEITSSYLYKDILEYESIKSSSVLIKLLKAIALQIGSEVSYRELGQILDLSPQTVEKYINLLEKTFILFSLSSLSRNLRNELKRSTKIYFWDLGVRNSLLQNFLNLDQRSDVGKLWENFCIAERIKRTNKREFYNSNNYFWRTTSQQEIDFIEEKNGQLTAFEFKWSDKKVAKLPEAFSKAYPNSQFRLINKENWMDLTLD
jgi:predicted AAA+ superfamily ATPase